MSDAMFDSTFFDDLAKQLSSMIPPQLSTLKQDLESNFKNILQSCFSKLDLVTREEFDIQVKLLHKTREKLELLEKQLTLLQDNNSS